MPGFPDSFAPFYEAPPGKFVSGTASRIVGSFIRPLRAISQRKGNMSNRWNKTGHIPSGWGHVEAPGALMKTAHYFYRKLQSSGSNYTPGGTRLQKDLQAEGHAYTRAAEESAEKRMLEESTNA